MSNYKQSKALDVLKFILLLILVFVLLGAAAFGAIRLLRGKQDDVSAAETGPTPLEMGKWYDKIYVNTANNGAAVDNYLFELQSMFIQFGNDRIENLMPFAVIPAHIDISMTSNGGLESLQDAMEAVGLDDLENIVKQGDFSKMPTVFMGGITNGCSMLVDYIGCMALNGLRPMFNSGVYGYQDSDSSDTHVYVTPGFQNIDKDGALLQVDGSYIHGTFLPLHSCDEAFTKVSPAVQAAFDNAFSATPFGNEYVNDFFVAKPFEEGQFDVYCFANTDTAAWKELYDYMVSTKQEEMCLLKVKSGSEIVEDAIVVNICDDPRGGNGWALEIASRFSESEAYKVYENSREFPTNGNMFGRDFDDAYTMYFTYYGSDAPKELLDKLLSRRPFKEYFSPPRLEINMNSGSSDRLFSADKMTMDINLAWRDIYNFQDIKDIETNFAERVHFDVSFKDPNSAWAEGKEASNYVAISDFSKDGLFISKITAKCLQPFGEYIIITAYVDGVKCDTYEVGYKANIVEGIMAYDGVEDDTVYRWYSDISSNGDKAAYTDCYGSGNKFNFSQFNLDKLASFLSACDGLSSYAIDGYEYNSEAIILEIREDWSFVGGGKNCLVGWDFNTHVEKSYTKIIIGGENGLSLDDLIAWLHLDKEKILQNEEEFYTTFGGILKDSFDDFSSSQNIFITHLEVAASSFKYDPPAGSRDIYISFSDEIQAKLSEYGLV